MRKETHAKKNTRWMKAVLLSFFALLLCSVSGYAQNITVTGKVSDAMGTLPGVSVAIKGTTNGTVTDVDGKYSLNVAKNATLVFSFVGMKSQEVTVNGRKVIDVTMTNDTELLDEVVVVGYGTSKKSSLTSAVSAVKGDELLKAPATNVSQLLGGRLPGISSLQESGEPGLDQASLKIRGSVYSVSYIVDGFPVSNINDLDPNDIESVSVLKDGASAAVYGLAGAGGVIIVTTKRGELRCLLRCLHECQFPEIHEWPAIRTLLQHGADDGPAGKRGHQGSQRIHTLLYAGEHCRHDQRRPHGRMGQRGLYR